MNRKWSWVWVLLAALLLPLTVGCAARATPPLSARQDSPGFYAPVELAEREAAKTSAGAAVDANMGDQSGLPDGGVDRMIIYNVYLDLIVQDTQGVFDEIGRLTQEMGGYVSGSNVWRDEGLDRASLTVRVPVGKLADALAQFRDLAVDVEGERTDSQDVTEEYVDLDARLVNEQRTEAELLELLESRSETGKTEDILQVHRELSQVRAQIEQIQGRMRYLGNLSDMATVQITLTPDALLEPIVVGGWQPQGTARNAIRMLLNTLQFFADAGIVIVLYVLPVLIVIAIPLVLLFLLARAIWRRMRRRKQAALPSQPAD